MENNIPKSTRFLSLSAAILLVIAYFSVNQGNKKSSIDSDDAKFSFTDTLSISKIILKNKSSSLELNRNLNIWFTKNQLKTHREYIKELMTIIQSIEARKIVYKDMESSVIKKMKANGVNFDIYSGAENIKNYTFLIDSSGIFAQMPDGDLFECSINNDNSNLSFIQNLNEHFWKDKTLFNSRIADINYLKVSYKNKPNDGFEIKRGLNKFSISEIPKYDSLKLLSYLDLYRKVEVFTYDIQNKKNISDSLSKLQPDFMIELTDKIPEKSNSISIYYQSKQNGQIYAFVGKNNDLAIIKPRIFEYLLQKRSFFEKK